MSDESLGNSPEHNFEDTRENFTETHAGISRGSFVQTLPTKFPKKFHRSIPEKIRRNFAETKERMFQGISTSHTGVCQ